jgi:uncharacterized protein (DUF4213/DUF364 family)
METIMKLLSELLQTMPSAETPIRDVRIGVNWTVVCSRFCGMAATYTGESAHGSQRVRDVGVLHHKSAQELARWLLSDIPLEASLGMAAFNSLVSVDENQIRDINAFDLLIQQGAEKNIAVIGHFPYVDRLANIASSLWVLEKHPVPGDFPAEAAPEILPKADIVAITSSTLINHTLEGLLDLCPKQALIMLLGPSTPLVPMLFDYGVDYLSGTIIEDEQAALLTIQQGASFQQVQGTRRVTLSRKPIDKNN